MAEPVFAADDEMHAESASVKKLVLEVSVNGRSTGLLGEFEQRSDGRLFTTPAELREFGLEPSRVGAKAGLIDLDALDGVTYNYDEATQSIAFVSAADHQIETQIHLQIQDPKIELSPAEIGAVLNYSVQTATEVTSGSATNITAQLDGRVFGPFGVVRSSFVMTSDLRAATRLIRLDSAWTFENPASMKSIRIGDSASSGLSWSRSVRFAGIQFGRSFALRPGLITAPMQTIRGTALMASSLDLYIDGSRQLTSQVAGGPFSLQFAPSSIGRSSAEVIVRDAFGREKRIDLSFYASGELLAKGLADYSIETGFPRKNFGFETDSYGSQPLASGTIRYGLTDRITVQAHGEATKGLVNLGLGGVFNVGQIALASASVAVSDANSKLGGLVDFGIEARHGPFSLSLRASRSLGEYRDLAFATADTAERIRDSGAYLPTRAVDQAQLNSRLWSAANVSLSYARVLRGPSASRIASAYFTQRLGSANLYIRGSRSFERNGPISVALGFSMPLGAKINSTAEAAVNAGRATLVGEASGRPVTDPGDVSWRVRQLAGSGIEDTQASLSYMSRAGRFEAGLLRTHASIVGFLQADGAVAFADNRLFASRRLDSPFAVVNVGAKGVDVSLENRLAGKTRGDGRILVPNLLAYEPSRVTIDSTDLPMDEIVTTDRFVVVPGNGGVAVLKVKPEQASNSALVTFVDAQGEPMPPGSTGSAGANAEPFVLGYDGLGYLTNLTSENTAEIQYPGGGTCIAHFSFMPARGQQVHTGPIKCIKTVIIQR